jgi:GT2 family glycosyltransferase/ribosomal protein L29
VPETNEHLSQLNAELDELRHSLVRLRSQLSLGSAPGSPARPLESVYKRINALRTVTRSLQAEMGELRLRAEKAEREAWDQQARRADTTAKLKGVEELLGQIQRSALWKTVKPLWKLFNRSRRDSNSTESEADLTFAIDLPKQWKVERPVLLIKGWCLSRSGRKLAGVRVKVGRKARFAEFGLERKDLGDLYPEHPQAVRSGFSAVIKVPPGESILRLEAIHQGSQWELFFQTSLYREPSAEDEEEEEETSITSVVERITVLPPLSAAKAFELVQPGFERQSRRVTNTTPLFSVVTPTYESKPEWLAAAALSLLQQSYADWEWCLVDDGSQNEETLKMLASLSTISPRVRVQTGTRSGISAATNRGLELARGNYVCFLDHDDLLHPAALEMIAKQANAGYDVIYSDEDKLDDTTGRLVEPFFKPDWSPEYFRGAMYVGHLLCVRRQLALKTRFDSAFDGVQDFEFMLRLSEQSPSISHVPQILYHWRKTPGSIAENTEAKPKISLLQEQAVNAHLARLDLPARAEGLSLPHRLRIHPLRRDHHSRVSIVIPSKDAADVLGRCLHSLFEITAHPNFEVIVMDNESRDPAALRLMEVYPVRRIPFPDPFNFSRANNEAAAAATGELLVFLNNDTEIISPDWLDQLAFYAEQPDVGAAGAVLVYEDMTVQHAGVVLGMRGTADHVMRKFPADVDGYAGSLACAREVTAVTGACLMVRKRLFDDIGGFNPHFFTAYQDLDLCLRLRARGLRIICAPQARLYHHEYTSRRSYYDMIDRMLLLDQWEEVIEKGDPYYNRNLDLERGDYSPRLP